MGKRKIILLGGLLIVIALIAIGFVLPAVEENRLRHGDSEDGIKPAAGLTIASPREGETVTSPLVVTGEARGNWYFEASFPVRLEDASGRILGEVPAQARGEWMTADPVPFVAELTFSVPGLTPGRLVLRKANASGLPEHDGERSLAVMLSPLRSAQVYFMNALLDPEFTCEKVWPVERAIQPGADPKLAALEALLAGPTNEEIRGSYSTEIDSGVVVNAFALDPDSTAHADFSARLDEAVAGSCRVGAIRAQITATLRQFPDVREVVISVDGRVEDILQP
jgi:hypothetical protein